MKRFFFLISLIGFILLCYGVYVSQLTFSISPALQNENPSEKFLYEYQGILNVHSNKSTGSGSIQNIIESAQNVGMDFIIITDPNTSQETIDEWEGYHDQLLVLFGQKTKYLDSKLIQLTTKSSLTLFDNSQLHLTDLLTDKSPQIDDFVILAHPFNKGNEWSGLIPKGLQGLEVINLKSIWQNTWLESKLSLMWTPILYPFNPDLALTRLYERQMRETQLWDHENQVRKLIGFAGTDAESRFILPGGKSVNLPSYSRLFTIISNHVVLKTELTGEFKADKQKIFSGLFRGQHFMGLDIIGSSQGFRFYAQEKNKIYLTGSSPSYTKNISFRYSLPYTPTVPFKVELYKNGKLLSQNNEVKKDIKPSGPGQYRLEVLVLQTTPLSNKKRWVPWVITNNIYLKK